MPVKHVFSECMSVYLNIRCNEHVYFGVCIAVNYVFGVCTIACYKMSGCISMVS